MRHTTRGLVLLLLTALVGLVGLVVGTLPASAHSRLLSITPEDGASLPASPTEVVLTFNEEVNPQFVTVRVTDGEGGVVAGEDATANGAVVTLPVPDPVAAGSYKVTYRVVSADSHPISGSTSFSVQGDPLASPTAGSAGPSASPSAGTRSSNTPAATGLPNGNTEAGDDDAASGGAPTAVWFVVFAALAGAVAATLYAVRKGRGTA
jgi:methionine-rich copper-binding protein CopC